MLNRLGVATFLLCAGAFWPSDVHAQQWRHFTSTDEMTGEKQAFATSPRVRSNRPMASPYTGVRGWLGFGCDGRSEWVFFGFTESPNLIDTRPRDGGYSTFSTRIKWDAELQTVSMRQDWGDRFLSLGNDAEAIARIETGNSVLLELEWYGSGRTHFSFPLAGSARAINQARAACGSSVPSAAERQRRGELSSSGTPIKLFREGERVRVGTCDLGSFVPLHSAPGGSIVESRIERSDLCGSFAAKAEVLGVHLEGNAQTWLQVRIPQRGLEGWVASKFVRASRR